MYPTYLYHALACGVSGHITLPSRHVIPVQAPSALPFTGGHSETRVEQFCHEHTLSFSSAHSSTTGNESEKFHNTLATATIVGLNIHNVVMADRVVARLASRYMKETGERSTTFAGSHFENLRIAGCPIKVEIDPERLKSGRRSARVQFGTFAAPIDAQSCWGLEVLKDGAIHVPQFGKIYLAESMVTACYQTISMIRVVLGCAVEGHMIVAHTSTNGEPMP